ncbi:MAG: glycosyltransferase [Halobacteria archaeon]
MAGTLALDIFAVVFGSIWITVGIYKLAPVAYFLLDSAFGDTNVYIDAADELNEEELPTIDILLPAYDEEAVIKHTLESIRDANYPQELISLNVMVEPNDESTREALKELKTGSVFETVGSPRKFMNEIVVPEEYPGESNKPRALNYGFEETYADVVGVLDAEDEVDPDLFRKVAGALDVRNYDYVQGILDMENENDGWMNMMFRGEYGWWYRLHLPAFHNLNYPVPLGGTTNFVSREVLEEISDIRKNRFGHRWEEDTKGTPESRGWLSKLFNKGLIPWDPINVTEDFELGHLLWMEGYDLALIDSVTEEESPRSLTSWIDQRSRWEKGKIFTFRQYLKHPPGNLYQSFHVMMQSVLPHLGIINIVGVLLFAILSYLREFHYSQTARYVLFIGFVLIFIEMVKQTYGYWVASDKPVKLKIPRAVVSFVTLPVYWLPFWFSDVIAMKEIYTGDRRWKKTPHEGRHYSQNNDEN